MSKESLCSEHCHELTSSMDLSTLDLAEAKLSCLSKEARSIRKRLSQIEKLEKSESKSNVLSEEEQRKVSRRPQLEADLLLFEPAIESVERKLKSLSAAEQEEKPVAPVECSDKDVPPEIEKLDAEPIDDEHEKPPLRCEICQITCPDANSLHFHLNGRKHRNRVAQVEATNKKQAAASMMEEQQRQLLLNPARQTPTTETDRSSPWGQKVKTGSVEPKYKLPPPPHAIQDDLSSPGTATASKPKSLQEIMAEESRLSKRSPLQLPPGTAPSMNSPPWATPTARVAVSTVTAIESTTAAASTKHSLGDFIANPVPKVSSPRPTGWASPKAAALKKVPSPSLSFRDIQEQEQDFKAKQDHTFGENGKWFIERRERAGSFKEIQSETIMHTEEQRLIEEQIQIEKQIYEELAAQKAKEKKEAQKRQGKRRNKNAQPKEKAGERTGQPRPASAEVTKPKGRPRKRTSFKAAKQQQPSDKKPEDPNATQGQLKSPPPPPPPPPPTK